MPRVPVTPQAKSAALGPNRFSVNPEGAFGEDVGRGLRQLGGDLQAVGGEYRRELERADVAAATNAENEFQKRKNTRLYDRNTGVMNAIGEGALRQAEGFYEADKKDRDELEKSLANDRQRQLFRARADALDNDSQRQVETHVSREARRAQGLAAEARASTALDNIALNYTDAASRATHAAAAESAIRAANIDNPAAGEQQVAEFRKKADAAVLNQFISARNIEGAQAYFAQAKERLGADAARFQSTLGELQKDVAGERSAISIVDGAKGGENGWVDEKRALEELDKLPAGPDKDEARARIVRRLEEARKQKDKDIASRFNKAFSAYEQRHAMGDINADDKRWLKEHAPEDWAKLEDRSRRDIAYFEERNEKKQKAARVESPEERVASIQAQADMVMNPAKYVGMTADDLAREWGAKLAPSAFKALGEDFVRAKRDQFIVPHDFSEAIKDEVALSADLGANGGELGKRYAATMGQLYRQEQERLKRPLTIDEVAKVRAAAWKDKELKRGFFAELLNLEPKKVPAFKAPADEAPAPAPAAAPAGAPAATALPAEAKKEPEKKDAPKKSKADRARELKGQGKNNKEIAETLTAEGY